MVPGLLGSLGGEEATAVSRLPRWTGKDPSSSGLNGMIRSLRIRPSILALFLPQSSFARQRLFNILHSSFHDKESY